MHQLLCARKSTLQAHMERLLFLEYIFVNNLVRKLKKSEHRNSKVNVAGSRILRVMRVILKSRTNFAFIFGKEEMLVHYSVRLLLSQRLEKNTKYQNLMGPY